MPPSPIREYLPPPSLRLTRFLCFAATPRAGRRRRPGFLSDSVPRHPLGELGCAAGVGESHQGGQDCGHSGPRLPHAGGDSLSLRYRQGTQVSLVSVSLWLRCLTALEEGGVQPSPMAVQHLYFEETGSLLANPTRSRETRKSINSSKRCSYRAVKVLKFRRISHPNPPFFSPFRAQESMLEANRSRARMAKAWETPGKSGKSSRRAAAVAASVAISNFASDMDVDAGESPAGSGAGKRRSSRGEGGGSADKRQRR